MKNKIKLFFVFVSIIISFLFINAYVSSAKDINKYKILVDVEESRLYLLKNEQLEKIYKCSGGKESTPSPIGTWTIISKGKWGEGFRRKLDGI